ncbi:MAG: hypothetical protein AUJ97_01835 [Bacteroidetes bacterium CG2_30_32_10]|nr:MAG: hypothetical protein AUJ97_01835 [Bacteroidetes bacterium CG2_30_32_10]
MLLSINADIIAEFENEPESFNIYRINYKINFINYSFVLKNKTTCFFFIMQMLNFSQNKIIIWY